MAKSQQGHVYSCRKTEAEFFGSVADGFFRERVPVISHQKEALQDIRRHDSLRERRVVKYSTRNVSKSFILVVRPVVKDL